LKVRKEAGCDAESIDKVEIETFLEACTLFQGVPRDSEQAQYSVVYPVAAALLYGDFGPEQVANSRIPDERVVAMARKISIRFREEFQPKFPMQRLAEVAITIGDRTFRSGVVGALGDAADDPLPAGEVERKFLRYTAGRLSAEEQQMVLNWCGQLEQLPEISEFVRLLSRKRVNASRSPYSD
jgi:2-methylcitrate dehydratase PrpD